MEFVVLLDSIDYSIGRYKFHINYWYLIIFLLTQTLLNELGFWQLNRAKDKQVRLEQLEIGKRDTITSLSEITNKKINQFQVVKLDLTPIGRALFLDNKINNKKPGYHVINLAKDIHSGKVVLVNRGWTFAGLDRREIPDVVAPNEYWEAEARVYPIAKDSILAANDQFEWVDGSIRLAQLDLNTVRHLEDRFNLKIEPYLLRLNKSSQHALETNWLWINMSPEKHLAYAIQWFALALTLLIISVIASVKKR